MSMRFKRTLAALFAGAIAAGAVADREPPVRLDVSARPEGAAVWIDGKARGAAPVSVFDLEPGPHLIHVEAEGCRDADEFVRLAEGDFRQRHFELERECAIVLVRTEPAGARVTCDGVDLGTTPLAVTSLPAGRTHVLELSHNGYRTARVSVAGDARLPAVCDEKLVLDSGTLSCSSEPAGATVLVNGVERGVTPCRVENVPKGNAMVTLRLQGWEDVTRELYFTPGDSQTLHLALKARPARLRVVTMPEGGMVYVDGSYQGKAPVTAEGLKPGERKVTVKMYGHAPMERAVTLANGDDRTEEFRLDSVLGRIEVTTLPGARIYVDGKSVGTAVSRAGSLEKADVFAVERVDAGERQLLVRLDGHQDASRKVLVKPSATTAVTVRPVRLFVPDVEVETVQRTYRGMLISRDASGITIEVSPGVEQTFPDSDVRRVEPIRGK